MANLIYFYQVYDFASTDSYFYQDFDNAFEKAKDILHENYIGYDALKEEEEECLTILIDTWQLDGIVEINKCKFED